jgi:RHS repeat-associated protein
MRKMGLELSIAPTLIAIGACPSRAVSSPSATFIQCTESAWRLSRCKLAHSLSNASASTSVTHQYDAAGNLQTDGLHHYHYDSQGRLQSSQTGQGADAPTTRYAHNALGQRVFKTEPLYAAASGKDGALDEEEDPGLLKTLVDFFTRLWNPAKSEAEHLGWAYVYDEEGSLLGEYGMGGSQSAGQSQYIYLPTAQGPIPIAADIDNRLYAIHTDHLGTPRRLTQADGQAAWQWAYSAYGDEAPTLGAKRFTNETTNPTTGSTNIPPVRFNLRYPGQYFDEESGLHYNYFRSYDPRTGRYTQTDPIGLDGGFNRFAYVGGNPLGFTDPMGLQAYNGQTPPPNIPGGPWTPQEGQKPGTFQGPKNPNGGARDQCRYVPDEGNGGPKGAKESYWKTKEPGKPWTRFDKNGIPITPEQAHPGNQPPPRSIPWVAPGSFPLYPWICPLCNVILPPVNGPS